MCIRDRSYIAQSSLSDGFPQILEYTLFQPGLFLDYLASPYKTSKYVTPLDTFIDFQNRRAIVVEGYEDAFMSLTTVQDIAGVVAGAIEVDEWPEVGGIRGNRATISNIIEIGEKLRGELQLIRSGKYRIDCMCRSLFYHQQSQTRRS